MSCTPPRTLMGYGSWLQMWDNAAEAWVFIGGTSDLSVPEVMREYIETNSDDGDGTIHYQGVPQYDLGEVTYTIDFIKEQHARLLNLARQTLPYQTCWRVVINNAEQTYYKWCAGIMTLTLAIPKKELITSDLSLKATGGGLETGALNA